MINFVKSGKVLDYNNGGGDPILSSTVVVMGSLIGIAIATIAPGDRGSVQMEGVVEITSNVGIPAIGTPMFYDTVHFRADTDPTVGPFMGNVASTVCDLVGGVRIILPYTGSAPSPFTAQAAIPNEATVNASDLATAIALVNALKADYNGLLAMLRAAGIIAP